MIAVHQLVKAFDTALAVNGVSFEVPEGKTLVLLGTSGCGKTTTLKMINRLIEPTRGEIYIGGDNVLNKDPVKLRREIGYVIQHNGLFPHYSVAENIATVPRLLKWTKQEIRQQVNDLLDMLQMDPKAFSGRYPAELSGGQQQRIAIARALASNPKLLLMDEPFGALDPITRLQVRQNFKKLNKKYRKTIVMVTHDIFEALEMGDQICLMDEGKIAQLGSPADLIFRPKSDFVHDFFAAQRFEAELKALRLEDIIPLLPGDQHPATDNTIELDMDTDLLIALESISTADEAYVSIMDEGTNKGFTSREQIMDAVEQYKAKNRR